MAFKCLALAGQILFRGIEHIGARLKDTVTCRCLGKLLLAGLDVQDVIHPRGGTGAGTGKRVLQKHPGPQAGADSHKQKQQKQRGEKSGARPADRPFALA
ncbi:MAG TPA: hypothetical protein PKK86_00930 [Candidatus Syntrophosphaera sp.]|nr:hypothetical protein [Candidatus Syntrophosphaera sp.]